MHRSADDEEERVRQPQSSSCSWVQARNVLNYAAAEDGACTPETTRGYRMISILRLDTLGAQHASLSLRSFDHTGGTGVIPEKQQSLGGTRGFLLNPGKDMEDGETVRPRI